MMYPSGAGSRRRTVHIRPRITDQSKGVACEWSKTSSSALLASMPHEDREQELLVALAQSELLVQQAVEYAAEGACGDAQSGGREDKVLRNVAGLGDQHAVPAFPVLALVTHKVAGEADHRRRAGHHRTLHW